MKTLTLFLTLTLLLTATMALTTAFAEEDSLQWLPEGAIARLGKGAVYDIKFSADGTRLIVASGPGVRHYDARTDEETDLIPWDMGIEPLLGSAFSPDDTLFAFGDPWGDIRVLDAQTGEFFKFLEGTVKPTGYSIAFSADGRTLAGAGNGIIELWDVDTGESLYTLEGHADAIYSLAFSADGRTLASGSGDSTIRLWDVATGKTLNTLTGHTSGVYRVSFSADGRTLASGSRDSTIRLWDVATGETRNTLTGHKDAVLSLAFSPDGSTLASSGDTLRLWDVATGETRNTLTEHWTRGGLFSPDGKTLAGGYGQEILLWDVATGDMLTTLTGHTDSVLRVAFSPDGRTLASGSYDNTIYLWDVATGETRHTLTGHTDSVLRVAFSPDGRILAGGTGWNSGDKAIRLWDVQTGHLRATLTGHTKAPNGFVFSPDGTTLISTSYDSTIRVWDVRNGRQVKVLGVPCTATSGPAISPDGRFIAVGDGWHEILLIDPTAEKIIGSFPGHEMRTETVAINPDGTTLASGSHDGTIILWDLTPFTSTEQPPQEQSDSVRVVYFQPSDRDAQPGIDANLRTLVTDVQQFYARQMEAHGHGEKTITFATDANGNVSVHHFTGKFTDAYYQIQTYDKVHKEISEYFYQSKHVYLVVIEISSEVINDDGTCGVGGGRWWNRFEGEAWHRDLGGLAVIPASGNCFNVGVTAHELGHAMGLDHDFRDDTYLMAYGSQQRLSREAAAWLDASRLFNPSQPDLGQPAAIEVLSNRADQLRFQLTDGDGLHQAQLLIPTTPDDPAQGTKLHRSQALNGKQSLTIAFSAVPVVSGQEVTLQVIDVHGNIAKQTFPIEVGRVTPASIAEDVNEDGVVNFADLSLAALRLGEAGQNRADVNGDGVVDVADLLLIAAAIRDAAGAPARHPHVLEIFTAAEVQQWLKFARQLALTEPAYQRGIAALEQLLALLTPKETVLLANYPNPFNPETWLPYRLAEPAEVTVRIYAANGSLIRTLALGHLPAGIYEGRSRAAYWDGRNALGEPVASGVYFYTLSAGDFSATRKMLIRK